MKNIHLFRAEVCEAGFGSSTSLQFEVEDNVADIIIRLPEADEVLMPMVAAVPLQLIAYYTAVLKGCDVDKPRNLAKVVTVE